MFTVQILDIRPTLHLSISINFFHFCLLMASLDSRPSRLSMAKVAGPNNFVFTPKARAKSAMLAHFTVFTDDAVFHRGCLYRLSLSYLSHVLQWKNCLLRLVWPNILACCISTNIHSPAHSTLACYCPRCFKPIHMV